MQVTNTLKENSSSVNGAQGMKYRKSKLTNPKPFRLRTDVCKLFIEYMMLKRKRQNFSMSDYLLAV